jgi:putative acetyltransferase
MINIIRTTSENPDFIWLVKSLDADLAIKDGEDHAFYAQYNKIDKIKFVVVVYENESPIGCGAIKEFDTNTMEVKRMYVIPERRGKGYASKILMELEKWASELSFIRCVLETGKRQHDAIGLYKKSGYQVISNYGQYTGMENSVCFEKKLVSTSAIGKIRHSART